MAELLLFHHAQGLTPGIVAFADRLREHGHTVQTPDLFDGRTFDRFDEAMAHLEDFGFPTVIERATTIAAELPAELVYGGFSVGVLAAQYLAQNRAGARGALLCYSCVPASEFGSWPDGLPAQIHGMDADPIFTEEGDLDAARELVSSQSSVELFLYPGDQHYFADSSLPGYDPEATDLLVERALTLLAAVG